MTARRTVALVIICAFAGCGSPAVPTATMKAIDAAKIFLDVLTVFKGASDVYRQCVSDAVEPARKELSVSNSKSNVKIELPKVASDWELKWMKVEAQTVNLEAKFKDVGRASDAYWMKLAEVTSAIRDKDLRDREQSKNTEAKDKWNTAYKNAESQIEKIKALRDKGHDFHKVLLGAALRRQIAEYTETLNSIADEASSLLRELEGLTEQGKTLINL